MYSTVDRQRILEELTDFFRSIEAIRGAILLGSGTLGFTDEFSDLDFMLGVRSDSDCVPVKDLILEKLNELGHSFGKIVEFKERRYIIVGILENFLELDISVVPVNELVTRTEQWKVLFDKDSTVYEKMTHNWQNRQLNTIIEVIENNNLIVETTYLLRRGLFELARGNEICAANLTNEIRENILLIECLIEKKKVHQFKNYASLDPHFKEDIKKTYVGTLERNEILSSLVFSNDLFFTLIKRITSDCNHLKYKKIIDQYVEELF